MQNGYEGQPKFNFNPEQISKDEVAKLADDVLWPVVDEFSEIDWRKEAEDHEVFRATGAYHTNEITTDIIAVTMTASKEIVDNYQSGQPETTETNVVELVISETKADTTQDFFLSKAKADNPDKIDLLDRDNLQAVTIVEYIHESPGSWQKNIYQAVNHKSVDTNEYIPLWMEINPDDSIEGEGLPPESKGLTQQDIQQIELALNILKAPSEQITELRQIKQNAEA